MLMKAKIVEFRGRQDKLTLVGHLLSKYLKGDVLDVGCGEKHLSTLVRGRYVGIDIAGKPDIIANVEPGIPFRDMSFDTVVAFDILEHSDNIHFGFDELCRVARRYVIIGLPNIYEWRFRLMFVIGRRLSGKYGLPVNPPLDRHRWLFSFWDARSFIHHRASRAGFEIIEEFVGLYKYNRLFARAIGAVGKTMVRWFPNLFAYHYWAILERIDFVR